MKKETITWAVIAAILLLAMVLTGARYFIFGAPLTTPTVEGHQASNTEGFFVGFIGKDQSDEAIFALEKGEELEVSSQVEKGRVDLVIGISGEKPIYKGNDFTGGDFTITADQTGEYIVSVEAKDAAGYVMIEKADLDK